jgi:hypothetical protein
MCDIVPRRNFFKLLCVVLKKKYLYNFQDEKNNACENFNSVRVINLPQSYRPSENSFFQELDKIDFNQIKKYFQLDDNLLN